MIIKKCIRDGKVAVLYSPGFGAGWTSWNSGNSDLRSFMTFDSKLVEMAESGEDAEDVLEYIQSVFPEEEYICVLGWKCVVAWLPEGTAFRINEYDGSEQIVEYDPGHYFVA